MLKLNRATTAAVLGALIAVLGLGGCSKRGDPKPKTTPGFYLEDARTNEGDALVFTVRLSPARDGAVSVGYKYVSGGTATAGSDFQAFTTGQVTIPAGGTAGTFTVTTIEDTLYELDETVLVELQSASGADIVVGSATGTIANDDPKPTVELLLNNTAVAGNMTCSGVAACAIDETNGARIELAVHLSAVSGLDATIPIATTGTALHRGDYVFRDKTSGDRYAMENGLVIPAGQTEKRFHLDVIDDGHEEAAEQLTVALASGMIHAQPSTSLDEFSVTVNANDTITYTAPAAPTLNDTGIVRWADASANYWATAANGVDHPRQDVDVGLDPAAGGDNVGFDFVKLDADGNVLGIEATGWACVEDRHTNLVWEVKTGINEGLHASSRTVTWYEVDSAVNGGGMGDPGRDVECAATGTSHCNTSYYVADVNLEGLCGRTGWRLPTLEELRSIADYGRDYSRIDSTGGSADRAVLQEFFPYTNVAAYWSSTPYAAGSTQAWTMGFYRQPSEGPADKGSELHIRLVSGP